MPQPLFLDTTIQVDKVLQDTDPVRSSQISQLLAHFSLNIACGYSRLEYKRVVLQRMALLLRYLVEHKSFFGALRRSQKLRVERQAKSLANILAWVGDKVSGSVVTTGDSLDSQLCLRAESYLRTNILFAWHRFAAKVELVDAMKCQRGKEGPVKRPDGAFDVAVPESQCRNRQCNNAGFFQTRLPVVKKLCDDLDNLKAKGVVLTDELNNALTTMRAACSGKGNFSILFDYQRCLKLGDVWIHLESVEAGVADFATTNYKESRTLCKSMGLVSHDPTQPDLHVLNP